MQPSPKNSLFPQWDSFRWNSVFICKRLSVGDCFWVRDGGMYGSVLSSLGPILSRHCVVPVSAPSVHASLYDPSQLILGVILMVSSMPSAFYVLSTFSCTFCLGLNVPRSLIFSIISNCGSLNLFPFAAGRNFSDNCWARNYLECSRSLLGIILLFLFVCSFCLLNRSLRYVASGSCSPH